MSRRPGRTSQPDTVSDHEARVSSVERRRMEWEDTGSPYVDRLGIHFDSDGGVNVGDKVDVTTSGILPFSYGLDWDDHSTLGIRLRADASIEIQSDAATTISGGPGSSIAVGSSIEVSADTDIGIHALGGDVIINTATSTDAIASTHVGVFANDGNLNLFGLFGVTIAAHLGVQSSTAYTFPSDPDQFLLSSARDLTVLLHKDVEVAEPTTSFIILSGETAFPRQLFRVDSDNTIHGPTGGAMIWDL